MNKSKAIMVNSYKGGAGKTTTSMVIAITGALYDSAPGAKNGFIYDEVHYFDIDLYGSGTMYAFFPKLLPSECCFNQYRKIEDINKFCNKVSLTHDMTKKKHYICAYIMDPKTKRDGRIYGTSVERANAYILNNDFFVDPLEELINYYVNVKTSEQESRKLFVFDCSPGYRIIARSLIQAFSKIKNLSLCEVFTSTTDNAHVTKTIDNWRDDINTRSNLLSIPRKMVLVDSLHAMEQKPNLLKEFETRNKDIFDSINIVTLEYNKFIPEYNCFLGRRNISDPDFIKAYYNPEFYERLIHDQED